MNTQQRELAQDLRIRSKFAIPGAIEDKLSRMQSFAPDPNVNPFGYQGMNPGQVQGLFHGQGGGAGGGGFSTGGQAILPNLGQGVNPFAPQPQQQIQGSLQRIEQQLTGNGGF